VWIAKSAKRSHLNNSTITVQTDDAISAIMVRPGSGRAFIQRCNVTHEAGGGSAVKIGDGEDGVKLLDTTVSGQADASGTYSAIYNERDNSQFLGLSVDHGGDSGRHALTNEAANCAIRGGTYVSESHALVEGGDGTSIEGVTARSRSGKPALQILGDATNLTLSDNDFEGGVEDER
jgi:hypothetical protein